MPKQLDSEYNEVAIPFQKMSFVPDVPSASLGPNEYNDGLNVETDIRGIRSVAGDLEILDTVPGTPTFVTGGFRNGGEFWFIVATVEGVWYATNGTTQTWYDITPTIGVGTYAQNTNITESWNGTIPFFNDSQNPPMFLPEPTDLDPLPKLVMYKGLIQPVGISAFTYINTTTYQITFSSAYTVAPYVAGDKILITGVNNFFNGTYTVVSCTTTTVNYTAVPGATPPSPVPNTAEVSSAYTWNYNPNWYNYYANFMRMFSTPNVGSILVAGNLTVTSNLSPITGTGNTTNNDNVIAITTASNLMLGKVVVGNGIPQNSIVTSVSVGVSVTISNDCTITASGVSLTFYSIETYPVTVQWSQAFGLNQAPLTWQPTITNVANQLEVPLRGPALDAFPCNGQFFLCSYWDTVVFSPINYSTTSAPILGVRLYNQGRGLLSSNCWANTDKLVYGVDARDIWVFDGTDFQGLGNQQVKNWFFDQLAPQYYDRVFMEVNSQKNQVEIYYPDSEAIDGVPNKMLSYRYDLQVWNAPRQVTMATFSCESPIWVYDEDTMSWSPNLGSRTIVYAVGDTNMKLVQKDYGYEIDNQAIYSYFKRNNIKLLKDYSGKLMVHRLLPEAVNLGGIPFSGNYNKQVTESTGNISVTIDGSNSVGQVPIQTTTLDMTLNTNNPWIQPNQNSHRVNTITIENTSNTNIWMCTATTWQFTQVEDDR